MTLNLFPHYLLFLLMKEFFQHPTKQTPASMQATMANVRQHLDNLSDKLHKVCNPTKLRCTGKHSRYATCDLEKSKHHQYQVLIIYCCYCSFTAHFRTNETIKLNKACYSSLDWSMSPCKHHKEKGVTFFTECYKHRIHLICL